MRAGRLLNLLLLLQNSERSTAAELADRLQVSTRTVLRDIEVLSANAAVAKELPKDDRPSTHQLEQLRLTNEYRMLMGLRALKFEQHLEQAAQNHSEEMVRLRYFDREGRGRPELTTGGVGSGSS